MPTLIKCPNCNFEFPLESALNEELKGAIEKEKQELRQQMMDYRKTKEEEIRRKEEEFATFGRQLQEKFRLQSEAEISKRIQETEANHAQVYRFRF